MVSDSRFCIEISIWVKLSKTFPLVNWWVGYIYLSIYLSSVRWSVYISVKPGCKWMSLSIYLLIDYMYISLCLYFYIPIYPAGGDQYTYISVKLGYKWVILSIYSCRLYISLYIYFYLSIYLAWGDQYTYRSSWGADG